MRMETPSTPTQTAIVAVPASGPGALPGFESTCSCGLVMRSSILTSAQLDVQQHAAWHTTKAGLKAQNGSK